MDTREEELWLRLNCLAVILPVDSPAYEFDLESVGLSLVKTQKGLIWASFWSADGNLEQVERHDALAQRFAAVLLYNVLGHREELVKPIHHGEGLTEPAYVEIEVHYTQMLKLYQDSRRRTALNRAMHARSYLNGLAQLLYSPQDIERERVAAILVTVATSQLRCLTLYVSGEVEWREACDVLDTIKGIMTTGLHSLKQQVDEIALRPVQSLFGMLHTLIERTRGTRYEKRFREIFVKQVMPLIGATGCHLYAAPLLELLRLQFSAAAATQGFQSGNWVTMSQELVRQAFRNTKSWPDKSDWVRVQILIALYNLEIIEGSQRAPLLKKLFAHVRRNSLLKTKLAFVKWVSGARFSTVFGLRDRAACLSSKLCTMVTSELSGWFLEENKGQGTKLHTALESAVNKLASPRHLMPPDRRESSQGVLGGRESSQIGADMFDATMQLDTGGSFASETSMSF